MGVMSPSTRRMGGVSLERWRSEAFRSSMRSSSWSIAPARVRRRRGAAADFASRAGSTAAGGGGDGLALGFCGEHSRRGAPGTGCPWRRRAGRRAANRRGRRPPVRLRPPGCTARARPASGRAQLHGRRLRPRPVHVLVEQLRGGGELDGLALLLGALAPGAHGGPDLAAVALEDHRHPSGRGPVLEPRRPGRGEAAAHLARGELGEDAGDLLRGELLPEHRDRAGRGPHQRGRARLEHQLGSLLPDETLEDWIEPGHEGRVYVKPPRCSPCWQAVARSGR